VIGPSIPVQKRAGRPRSQHTEKAILKAASQLLAESGLAAMTMEAVAARAGVGKASIYRRWPSKGALAFDATLEEYLAAQPARDAGSLEGDLLATARDWIRTARGSPAGRTLRGLIAEVLETKFGPSGSCGFVSPARAARVRRALGGQPADPD
jgi:AcrR family transcriptional regulator